MTHRATKKRAQASVATSKKKAVPKTPKKKTVAKKKVAASKRVAKTKTVAKAPKKKSVAKKTTVDKAPKKKAPAAQAITKAPTLAAAFLRALPPMDDVTPLPAAALRALDARLPSLLLDFLAETGWGRFGDGFLVLEDPRKLDETLALWLGSFDPSRVPIGRTALGDIVYFRDLRARAEALGLPNAESACDLSFIDVRYKRTGLLAMSLEDIPAALGDPELLKSALRKDLFDDALWRLGAPETDELYGFVPALALGGNEDSDSLHRVRAREHWDILFQL